MGMYIGTVTMEISMEFLKKLKIKLPYLSLSHLAVVSPTGSHTFEEEATALLCCSG